MDNHRQVAIDFFQNHSYLRHNQRRQEHLASLGLDFAGASVLEVGAGIGDHTSFFLDRGCQVVSTEPRAENLAILRSRYPDLTVQPLDLDQPDNCLDQTFDIVYCYGVLYHLSQPAAAIAFMAQHCRRLLLLETCVSFGEAELINLCDEPADAPTQSIVGQGCRPTRSWVYHQLKLHFEFVYLPTTQPYHEQFPIDWTVPSTVSEYTRAIFIAARQKLDHRLLSEDIPDRQFRH
ncbi:MAG: class I SAM-dependent methyltransferase [Aphanocapsa sp. GSE-SYN-MK-11-07L]|jgi:SAM-dependent methyltransferase|nr:class I SAM-dependent methyltransferase [Aphanocapsa sp. GSE-SYN-MK-11-07L]